MFIECHDVEQTDHLVWVRTTEVKSIHLRRSVGGDTWQVYVETAFGTFSFGEPYSSREDAGQAARGLIDNLTELVD